MTFQTHLQNSPIVQDLIPDYQAIAYYYNAIPDPCLSELINWMDDLESESYLRLRRFDDFLAGIYLGLQNNTINADARPLAKVMQSAIVQYGLQLSEDCKTLTQELFRREIFSPLQSFLALLTYSGVFGSTTSLLYQVEMTPQPRWQTLGLSSPPTASEIEALLT